MKQTLIKVIRDKVKSNYIYDSCCAICDSQENLELHHYHTIFYLVKEFVTKGNPTPETKEETLEFREKFINEYYKELVDETVTLCEEHHTKLHKLYGSTPLLHTSSKQRTWIQKQREKIFNPELAKASGLNRFKV